MTGIALIGCGKWGKNYLKTLNAIPDTRLLYVSDINQETLQMVSFNYPETKVVSDYEKAIKDPAVRAVVIATPPLTHYDIAANCMTNGKAVLVEKPITTSVEKTIKLADIARKTGQVMMTGHLMQYHPAVEAIKKHISDVTFGNIKFLDFKRTNANIFREDIDVLGDLSVHDLAVLLYLMEQRPQWVSARGIKVAEELPVGIISVDIGFSDNTLAHIHGNWHYHKKTRNISVIGTNGALNFDDTEKTDKKLALIPNAGDARYLKIEEKQPLYKQCEHFITCVKNKLLPRSGAEDAVLVMKVMEAVVMSIMKKRTIYL